ncbi:hypothetical protein [Dendronalium sp. ChiSLP03b]|uniref:hypothetical protein n=1 Tax=Dendronalium sp. ChiSLP03b TaxID=3075381 RepID=UPI002AD44E25|nr:hypothetical protein [Dendronalium sp. ChiSLP03b]MDZ8205484.1 hypothetical protein [Dendronalium sp. ChiSLP03b]
MSDRLITSNLLVALSTEQQQILAGGRRINLGNAGSDEDDFGDSSFDEGDSDEGDFGNNRSRGIRLRSGNLRLGGGDFSGDGFGSRRGVTFLKLTFLSM